MKILILEDELPASAQLRSMLLEIDPVLQIVASLRSVEAALEWLQTNTEPDLILSDIQLLDGISFDIFSAHPISCPIIFTTAYDQFAIRAFEVNSIDYLLKPIRKEKLEASLVKFRNRTPATPSAPPLPIDDLVRMLKGEKVEFKSRFMVRMGQRILAIPVETIAYFFSESKLSFIVTEDQKKYPVDYPLNEVESLLDPKHFFRINRQLIVRFTAISEMHPYFKGRIKIVLKPDFGQEIIVSSERSPDFKKWLEQ